MQHKTRQLLGALALAGLVATTAQAGSGAAGMLRKTGTPDLQSAGALGFAPEGILLVGDARGAAVFAIDTKDNEPASASAAAIDVGGINAKVAALLGTEASKVLINDVAVSPVSGKAYLSVSRGRGPDASPVIVRVDGKGKVEEVSLQDIRFDKADLPNPPVGEAPAKGQPSRAEVITDLGYVDGRVLVAGLSNEEFSSRLLSVPFPFAAQASDGAKIEIFHGAHGRFETKSPVRTFVTTKIQGEPTLLAAYQCTPLVKIPVADLKPGAHVKGTTIAELGNRNRPLDMITYKAGGKEFLLLANSSRGVMKIPTEGADKQPGITQRVADREGMKYDTIAGLKDVVQLDALGDSHALILVQNEDGSQDLKTIDLP